MTTDQWIMHIPVISTGHITKEASEYLSSDLGRQELMIAEMDVGWFVYVEEPEFDESTQECFPGLMSHPSLVNVFKWAQDEGYFWIRLDETGDEIDNLEQYDW